MRTHQIITVLTVILVAFGLKLIFLPAPPASAQAGSAKSVKIDVSEMHRNIKNLPVEIIHDMSFVFSGG